MDFTQYIKAELLILIPVLYLIGIAIKKSNIADKFIPWILGGVAVALSAIWVFANCPVESTADILTAIFTTIVQGVLIAGASVYCNQLIKQSAKTDEKKE